MTFFIGIFGKEEEREEENRSAPSRVAIVACVGPVPHRPSPYVVVLVGKEIIGKKEE